MNSHIIPLTHIAHELRQRGHRVSIASDPLFFETRVKPIFPEEDGRDTKNPVENIVIPPDPGPKGPAELELLSMVPYWVSALAVFGFIIPVLFGSFSLQSFRVLRKEFEHRSVGDVPDVFVIDVMLPACMALGDDSVQRNFGRGEGKKVHTVAYYASLVDSLNVSPVFLDQPTGHSFFSSEDIQQNFLKRVANRGLGLAFSLLNHSIGTLAVNVYRIQSGLGWKSGGTMEGPLLEHPAMTLGSPFVNRPGVLPSSLMQVGLIQHPDLEDRHWGRHDSEKIEGLIRWVGEKEERGLPVVFVSFGSIAHPSRALVGKILQALGSLQIRRKPHEALDGSRSRESSESFSGPPAVIWSVRKGTRAYVEEEDARPGGPSLGASGLLRLEDWVPQREVLQQGGVRVFMSHGGLNSLYEGMAAGVPLVLIPFFGDQPSNARRMEETGRACVLSKYASKMEIEKLLEDLLSEETGEAEKLISRGLETVEALTQRPGVGVFAASDFLEVKGPVGFSIPSVPFTRGGHVGACLHLDSQFLGSSDSGHTHQLSVVEDCHNFGLTCRYHGHPKSHEVVTFLETVWVPRFGIPQEIRCDQGSEFAGAPLIEFCEEHGIHLTFSPSGYKDGNSIVERWHRDVLASVRSILLERGLSPFQWPTVIDEAVRRLNNRMSVRGALSRHDEASLPPTLPCLRQFLSADRPPPPSSLRTYSVGETVMYNVGASGSGGRSGQEHKCGPVWYPYRVVRAENAHFYEIEATDPSFIPQKTTASPHQLCPAAVPPFAEMTSTTMPSPTPPSPSVAGVIDLSASVPVLLSFSSCSGTENPFSPSSSPLSVPPDPLEPGTMIVGRSPEAGLLWVGEIRCVLPGPRDSDTIKYEVHAWRTYQRCVLSRRQWAPGYYSSGFAYVTYDTRAKKREAELVELSHDKVVASGFEMDSCRGGRGFRLPSSVCSALFSGMQGCSFANGQYPGVFERDPAVASAVAFLSYVETSVHAATTHQPVSLKHLSNSEKELVCFADRKEDEGWLTREVYQRRIISEMPADVPRVPLMRVHTSKLKDDGSRGFKTCTVILGNRVSRDGLVVTTHLCPPDAVWYRPPLAAIPPSDHPDHGQYLWVLQKAVYGLPDAGQVFEDFFASKLTELRWTTGLFPGVWFLCDKDGKLRGIVATYVDDLLILGIGEDAASLVDPLKDFITCDDYTELTEGRFVGVQFEVTTDGVFTHQTDYISSLSLPPEHIGSSFKPADKPLPVGSTHEDDVSPPLDSRGASLFRTLLGQIRYVANCTRPDVALAHSYLSRFMAAPTERAFRLLLQTLRYLRTNPSLGIHIHASDSPDELTGVMHGDASFGNAASPHPQSAWILFINGFPLMHKSRRQPRMARSTTRAKFLALEDALDAAIYFAACMQPFYKSIRIGIGCDAANVLSLLLSGAPSSAERALLPLVKELKDHACVVPVLAATDLADDYRVGIFKVPTEMNIFDVLTKALDLRPLTRRMRKSPVASPVFGVEIVSSLPPLVFRE
uniref:Integrase catalytic domain-containing protein n=1 Tax=Chromera velia CCMP2878 TaxID=1169474 RepID=A0A0G4HPT3_9ALVE|eukprot:Cvel_1233.t1-p1 / transcript=Cvel_1233.t1 / gene=Cvel_1233 / organism=Chromera_velia_CCMP2878 / gene_product=Anthocyanidin 3-O-glucosyltransferase 2, putative / transcript_product=Anthocyanidin 3-O-glucosyltransferase 2, putative / location=Cvel_scaffold41:60955-67043(-) / protein_length=1504 / sequence_SO=supercontig / SO=protein_coding / is_pseudo=false